MSEKAQTDEKGGEARVVIKKYANRRLYNTASSSYVTLDHLSDMVKEGVVVIDVGTSRVDDASKKSGYRLAGDVDFEGVSPKAAAITPVPGGVGPMTITMLLKNTIKSAKAHHGHELV